MAHAPQSLAPVEGNYPGCIAAAALEFGEKQGDTSSLTDQLELIAEVCPHDDGESDLCLLSPIASHIGILAVESEAEQWRLISQISNATRIKYPSELFGKTVKEERREARCLDYEETRIPVSVVGDEEPAVMIDDVTSGALVYLQARGPTNEYLLMVRERTNRLSLEECALLGLSELVCAGTVDGSSPGVKASMQIDGRVVTLTDQIDGLIIHGNTNKRPYRDLVVPEDRILLPWPRTRTVEVELSDKDIHDFANRV